MENQQKAQDNFLTLLANLLAEELAEKAIPAGVHAAGALFKKIFHKHKEVIIDAATPVTNGNDCPKGYIRNSNGDCVPDVG